jgi:serine/threonine-protein kinase
MREPGLDAVSSISVVPSSQVLSAPDSHSVPSSRPPSSVRPRLLSAEISYAGLRSPMPPTPPQRGLRWPTWVAALACTWLAVVALVVAFALLLAPARTDAKATTPIAAALPEVRVKPGDALTAALTGKLRVTTSQKGVRATLDGVDRGEVPVTITDLAPGQHFLRLHGSASLEPIERTLMIDAGRTLHLSDVELKSIDTAAASDDEEDPVAKRKAALLNAANEAAERRKAARLDAHRRAVERIAAKKAAAKKAAAKKKRKKKLAAKLKAAAKKARAAKLAAAKEAKSEAKSQDVKATGTLNINSLPQSRAMVDGRPIGNTPIMGMKLPVGAHTVTFVHPKHGRKSVTVRVSEEKAAIAAHRFK